MKFCTVCGHRDNPYWRHSRFDYNADYMRWDDFIEQYPVLAYILRWRGNHEPVEWQGYFFYRRGTDGIEVYRVAKEDYKMPRERKKH